jgi:hypothetical protein
VIVRAIPEYSCRSDLNFIPKIDIKNVKEREREEREREEREREERGRGEGGER